MGVVHYLRDTLVGFYSGLGTWKDPARASSFVLNLLDRNQLENAYRSDWIAREIVDAPAEDACREWRDWQASNDQIEALEELEKKLRLQTKLKQTLIRARLYGGASLVVGVDDGNQSDEPLDLDKVEKDALRFVVVMNRYELSAGPRIYDVASEWYTRPEYYTVQTPMYNFNGDQPENNDPGSGDRARQMTERGLVHIHPSRVIEFAGNELPDWRLAPMGGGWGDSVLQTADDTLRQWGLTIGGVAAMVNDAKMDVIRIPDFSKNIATKEYATRLLSRFQVANQSKSTINSILLDKEEEWARVQTNFGGLPNLLTELMTVIAGAGRLPVSRLFGKAGAKGLGKSSSGQDELRNYYDGVASEQRTEITPRLEPLDQILIRSALGKADPNIHYAWSPLYNPEPKELADIAKLKAEAFQIDVTTGVINEDALRDARVNQLIEDGVYPGLEDAIDEHGAEPEIVEARVWSPGYDPVTGKPLAQPATSSLPKKTLGPDGLPETKGLPGPQVPKQITQQDSIDVYFYELLQTIQDADPATIAMIRDYNPDQPRGPRGQWETSHESYRGHDIFTVRNAAIGLQQYHVARGGKHMGTAHTGAEARAKVDEYARHTRDADPWSSDNTSGAASGGRVSKRVPPVDRHLAMHARHEIAEETAVNKQAEALSKVRQKMGRPEGLKKARPKKKLSQRQRRASGSVDDR